MNARREVCSVGRPDLEDLERFMWAGDAPYEKRLTGDGGVELFAKGRGGFMLAFWIAEYIQAGSTVDIVIGGNVALLRGWREHCLAQWSGLLPEMGSTVPVRSQGMASSTASMPSYSPV